MQDYDVPISAHRIFSPFLPFFLLKKKTSLKGKTKKKKKNPSKCSRKKSHLVGLNNIPQSTTLPSLRIDSNKHRRKKINRLTMARLL